MNKGSYEPGASGGEGRQAFYASKLSTFLQRHFVTENVFHLVLAGLTLDLDVQLYSLKDNRCGKKNR